MSDIPDFIIAGPGRAGTGWMVACLDEHPKVYIPTREIRYFSLRYDQSPSWYRSHFEARSSDQIVGEKSPSYFGQPNVARRIYDWNPDVHIIFSLRNPIDRAYSMYCMALRKGEVSEDIESELTPNAPMVQIGRYFEHLQPYREHFTDEQLHILIFDHLKDQPHQFARDLFAAVGTSTKFKPSALDQKFGHRKK